MEPSQYLLLNAIVVIALIGSMFFFRRGGGSQVKLNIKAGSSRAPMDPTKGFQGDPANLVTDHDGDMRSLNVVFQHEGQWYDAYEVLQIPAGATSDMIQKAFEERKRSTTGAAMTLLRMAYDNLARSGKV